MSILHSLKSITKDWIILINIMSLILTYQFSRIYKDEIILIMLNNE